MSYKSILILIMEVSLLIECYTTLVVNKWTQGTQSSQTTGTTAGSKYCLCCNQYWDRFLELSY